MLGAKNPSLPDLVDGMIHELCFVTSCPLSLALVVDVDVGVDVVDGKIHGLCFATSCLSPLSLSPALAYTTTLIAPNYVQFQVQTRVTSSHSFAPNQWK